MEILKDKGLGNLAVILECPICFEFCIPPIFQCINGHVFCSCCHEKIEECGICRVQLTIPGIRNLALEKVAEDVEVSCKNLKHGCTSSIKIKDIVLHNLNCAFEAKAWCRHLLDNKTDCNMAVTNTELYDHLLDNHDELLFEMGDRIVISQNNTVFNPPVCIQHDGQVFVVQTTLLTSGLTWKIVLAGKSNEASKYHAKITFPDRSIAISDVCKMTWTGIVLGIDYKDDDFDCRNVFGISAKKLREYSKNSRQIRQTGSGNSKFEL